MTASCSLRESGQQVARATQGKGTVVWKSTAVHGGRHPPLGIGSRPILISDLDDLLRFARELRRLPSERMAAITAFQIEAFLPMLEPWRFLA